MTDTISQKDKNSMMWGVVALLIVAGGIAYGISTDKIKVSKKITAVTGNTTNQTNNNQQSNNQPTNDALMEEVIPTAGVTLNVKYGNIGPEMIKAGVIDLEKFKKIYDDGGTPLTQEQLDILTKGSDSKIVVNENSSHFLLNLFWAFGLANNNKILTEGQMVKYGGIAKAGDFASTGGWTLAKEAAMNYYSKFNIAPLTDEQQKIVEDTTNNIYRPCCGNPTSFPDCNHGMAALGIAELMASQGATADEIFQAIKQVNSYWFAQTYYELAMYFKDTQNLDWKAVDAKTVLGTDYSSAAGAKKIHKYLQDKNLLKSLPGSGGGCGV